MKNAPGIVILLCGMGVGTALAAVYVLSLNYPGHDDSLTYLNIAGHLDHFYTRPPAGRWTTAGAWQSFWQMGPAWEFGTIRRHLVRFSLHPPLYFWLMHLWSHWLGINVFTGPLLNLLLYPPTAVEIAHSQAQAEPSGWQEVSFRLDRILTTVLHLYVPVRIAKLVAAETMRFWGLTAALILAAGAGALLLRRRLRGRTRSLEIPDYAWLPVAVSSATLLTYAAAYLAQLLPRPQLLDRQLLLVSPLLFVAAGQVLDHLIPGRGVWQWTILAFLLVYGLVFGGMSVQGHVRDLGAEPAPPFPDTETPVILGSVQAGVLPPILWYADPATPVYAASQHELLDQFPDVPSASSRGLYISAVRMGNTEEGQRSILERLKAAGFGQVEEKDNVFWQTTVYPLRRPGR